MNKEIDKLTDQWFDATQGKNDIRREVIQSLLSQATKQAKIDLLRELPITNDQDMKILEIAGDKDRVLGFKSKNIELSEWKNKKLLDIKEDNEDSSNNS